ncbi:MAG TPA: GNAT family N-acetyltransferase [Rhizomicrobium sp.]
MAGFAIRAAKQGDEDVILTLLYELAVYEKLTDKFKITREIIRRDYLCEKPLIHCELLFEGGIAIGIATWYWAYASFAAARALYLEDLFVRPDFRGKGYGKLLLSHLAQTAVKADAVRVEWSVLPWNTPSIEFYEALGAERMTEWLIYRLSGDALQKLGAA